MERTKGYLDFSPQSAPDTKFVPPKNTMNVIDTKERREHLSAYFGFMRLEVVHLMKEYGKKATRMTCQELYDRGKRVIPVRYFEYTVDRVMWMLWFQSLGFAGPKWPWGPIFPIELTQGENASTIFEKYCEERNNTDLQLATLKAKVDSSGIITVANPNAEYIVQSKAEFSDNSLSGVPSSDSEYDNRMKFWEEHFGKEYTQANVTGPFEAELPWFAPVETCVLKDLETINYIIPSEVKIQINTTNRTVITTFGRVMTDEGHDGRQELLKIWELVCGWVALVAQLKDITLLQHLLAMNV
ncbi:uncharacterized protein QYS62_008925 [Fusarium acuminatum]|uniref:Uncharacterized protein n=1 Tax=Fusarium acuminatum TaxID=5515 RepID=A0ABZ2X4V7_9HYPO